MCFSGHHQMSTPWGRYTIQIHLPSRYTNLRYIYPSLGIPTPQVYLSPDTYPPGILILPQNWPDTTDTYSPKMTWYKRLLPLMEFDLVPEIPIPHEKDLVSEIPTPQKGPGTRDTYRLTDACENITFPKLLESVSLAEQMSLASMIIYCNNR